MAEEERTGAPKPIYIGLKARYIGLYSLTFLVLMAILYGWFNAFGVPEILRRAGTAFDTGAAVSNVALDQTTVGILRENFSRALAAQVWSNLGVIGPGLALAFFAVAVIFISLVVNYAQRQMATLTAAARQIERGDYNVDLSRLYRGRFQSELSDLARAVEASGRAHLREQQLKGEVAALRIEIDTLKRTHDVSAIVETDGFQEIRRKAAEMRRANAEGNDAD